MSKKHHDLKEVEETYNILKDLPTEELLNRIST
jgi:hypothetical protein